MSSTAVIQTPKASGYLQQLCKHFGHKIPAEFTATEGTLTFEVGTARLFADDTTLRMIVHGPDLDRMEGIMGGHLERFAFREAITVVWTRDA